MRKGLREFLLALICAAFFFVAAGAEAGMISREQEIEMGRSTSRALEAQFGLYLNPQEQERVSRIGQKLAAVCGRDDLEFSFGILNSSEVNALACPGGFVYVFKGLLDYMPTDTELAGVLGHEIGHVAKKHTVNAVEKQLWTTLLLIAASRGQGVGMAVAAQQALLAGYSRTDERGADKEGVYNTIYAGFNPYSMLITTLKLDDLAKEGGAPDYGLYNSHPEPEERVKRIMKLLKDYDIHPDVSVTDDDHAQVAEGTWSFAINQSIGNTKASYRAYMLAGGLWTARLRGEIKKNYFVVRDSGAWADVYYDDIELVRFYLQDAGTFKTAGAYAAYVAEKLREWADIANLTPAKPLPAREAPEDKKQEKNKKAKLKQKDA